MDSEGTFSYVDGFVEFGAGVIIPTFDVYSDVSLTAILLSIGPEDEFKLNEDFFYSRNEIFGFHLWEDYGHSINFEHNFHFAPLVAM